jgi:hypothetical protein
MQIATKWGTPDIVRETHIVVSIPYSVAVQVAQATTLQTVADLKSDIQKKEQIPVQDSRVRISLWEFRDGGFLTFGVPPNQIINLLGGFSIRKTLHIRGIPYGNLRGFCIRIPLP